jgi:anaphase-promoting complex subunit 5
MNPTRRPLLMTIFYSWEKALATGDENLATENLRRYFEQHFHENNDSGVRQHALLNLIRMHYLQNEYDAARKLLQEAITVARTSGDTVTLQHCISMLHRLPPTEPGRKPILNEIQPDLNPLEVLFDVNKLMQVENDQPLSASFEKILQSLGLYDHYTESQPSVPIDSDQWSQHAVQAIVWSEAGCHQLAAVEENIVLAFTEVGGDNNGRLVTTLNQAYKRARQGSYEDALSVLLDPSVWQGITLNDYVIWANQVWHVLILRASRRGQDRLCQEVLHPNRPPGQFDPKDYFFNVDSEIKSKIRDAFHEVMQLRVGSYLV